MDVSSQQFYQEMKSARQKLLTPRTSVRVIETAAQGIFTVCAFAGLFAVISITLYMIANGVPAIRQIGLKELLFSALWKPVAREPSFGILYIVLSSVIATFLATLLGVSAGLLTAVFLAEIAPERLAAVVRPAVELLAGIPSVVYGLLGMMILNPVMYRWELRLFEGSQTHRFTGGANLMSAVLVLAVMILPTVISISESALRAVPAQLKASSMALGASHVQTIFRVIIPAARPGIVTAVVLGVGRSLGEAMAVNMVSGGSVSFPLPFCSVRLLTTAIVSEMGYAEGLHRQVLFTIGMILFLFIMLVNILLHAVLRRGDG